MCLLHLWLPNCDGLEYRTCSSFSRMSAMQSMFGVILLPVLLTVCLSFQPVAGEDPQDTCGTCATCYQTLADALINTENNRYDLSRGFFPPDAASPVLVKVTYHFKNCSNCSSKTWYWTMGAFYIYQPLEVFMFRSLFFSHISILQERIELQLPAGCFNAPLEYFELLTQRLKAYAIFQTATPRVDDSYFAKAISGDTKLDYKHHEVYGYAHNVHIDQLLLAYQYVPFIITFGIACTALIFLCCLCCKCKTQRKKISKHVKKAIKDKQHQAKIVAIVALCVCFTVYTFILDMISSHIDDHYDLPDYYEQNYGIYVCTIIFALISLLFLMAGTVCFIVLLGIWSYGPLSCCYCEDKEKRHLALLIPIVLCIESVILSLSSHFQNFLIAWNTDPFYASRIALYYGIVVFVYYLTFKNTFFLPFVCKTELTPKPPANKSTAQPPAGKPMNALSTVSAESTFTTEHLPPAKGTHNNKPTTQPPPSANKSTPNKHSSPSDEVVFVKCCNFCIEKTWGCRKESDEEQKKTRNKMRTISCEVGLGILCVVIVGALLLGFNAVNVVFVYYIPITNAIEESVHGVQTIYNGTVILIGALIAYNIGWLCFHPKSFSVENALKQTMKELKKDPFGKEKFQYGSMEKGWGDLSDEDRIKEVMKALLTRGAKKVGD